MSNSTNPKLSVILCTHNPRVDYLQRVLAALATQTLPASEWELLIVDNRSRPALKDSLNLSRHPNSRVIMEEELGLTPARLRGIKETTADLIVFVDDDNVLDSQYLARALEIDSAWPMLGVWGGRIVPEFEIEPPEWAHKYVELLAVREFKSDRWSNSSGFGDAPCGAGMCVRRIVAEAYATMVANDPLRRSLDRRGDSLLSCGDHDLGFTACDIGLGIGQFVSLKLTHLIPATRLDLGHMINLREQISYSACLLSRIRGLDFTAPSLPRRVLSIIRSVRLSPTDRAMLRADMRGRVLAARIPIESAESQTEARVATAPA